METYLLPVLIILLLIVINGVFVAAEFSFVASKASRFEAHAAAGSGAAAYLLKVHESNGGKDRYVAIAQLGITLASVGLGMYGEQQVAGWMYGPFEAWGLSHAMAHTVATAVSLSLITYMHVVFGEMIPKAVALQTPEKLAMQVQPIVGFFGVVFGPAVALLNAIAMGLMRLFRIPEPSEGEQLHTSKELSYLTQESTVSGELPQEQFFLINSIVNLDSRTAEELMTPRTRIEAISEDTPQDEVRALIAASGRSRYPVYKGSLDQISGMLLAKDFIRSQVTASPRPWQALKRALPSVSASATAEDLLELFKRRHMHAALVVDEYGGTMGLVTLDDLIADVVEDDQQDSEWLQSLPDGSYRIHGEMALSDLRKLHGLDIDSKEATTIAGVLLELHGTVPEEGMTFEKDGFLLTVLEVSGFKIMAVGARATLPPEEEA